MKPIHAVLVAWLDASDLSSRAVARELGRDPSYVSHLRAGRFVPGRGVAVKIERLTNGAVRVEDWDSLDDRATVRETVGLSDRPSDSEPEALGRTTDFKSDAPPPSGTGGVASAPEPPSPAGARP